jgi:hypothetical protein
MADRRRVGKRQRTSDESRLDALRRRVSELRSDDTPDGVDARTRGDDRSAVDARRVDVDDDAAAAANEDDYGDEIATADGSKPRSRVAKAKARAAREIRDRADADSVKAAAKKTLDDLATDEGAPNRAPGTTGTQTEAIAKRATDAAAIRSPMGGSLRTIGDERVVTDMARAPAAQGDELVTGTGLDFEDETAGDSQGAASDAGFVGVSVGFGAEDTGADEELGFDDPFGLTGDTDDDRDDDEDDPFPGVQLLGGD